MILRSMIIQECWCKNCSAGQMDKIHDILLREKVLESALIGRKIVCDKCGFENEIEDIIGIIPTSFLVSSKNETSKIKSNDEIMNWLNEE